MASRKFEECNLFADSDCENDTNMAEIKRRKRDNDIFDVTSEDIKKQSLQNDEASNAITDDVKIKSEYFQTKQSIDRNPVANNQLWSIEGTLFYPLGIRSHYIIGVNKSVLLIWSDSSVINFVIKKNPKTKQTKTTCVRLYVPNDEHIKDIQVLEFNTLLLLESGRINFFSSSKSMHTLPWLDSVRCIAAYPNGFSVIRLSSDCKLMLEVYEDIIDMGMNKTGPIMHKYDITFDEQNIFNCGWHDEHYFLLSTPINESNFKFLQLFTRNTFDLNNQKELHLFVISGNVFSLLPDIDGVTYHIEMLFSYSSNVAFIKLDFERRFCFIFLQCGVIDVWYTSSRYENLRHKTHSIGTEHTSFSYSETRAALYFTDNKHVAEFSFSKIPESDELTLHETYKAIPGVLACTWIEAIEQLVCLDCNNIFHQLSFNTLPMQDQPANFQRQSILKTSEFEKFNTLFELTPQRVTQLLDKAHILKQLNELPKTLYHDIEQQFRKQELLAMFNKRRFYKSLLSAYLEFNCGVLNFFQKDVIPIYTQNHFMINQRSLLALIYVEINQNDIFQSSVWQLHLQFDGFNHIFTLPKSLMRKKFCLIVPLEMHGKELLPKFRLYLYTFVSCNRNFIAIALPISIIMNNNTFAQLFTNGFCSFTKTLCRQPGFENLLEHFNRQKPKLFDSTEITCCISVPKSFELGSISQSPDVDSLLTEHNCLELMVLGSKLSVCHDFSNNVLILKCDDAATLFYLKIHLQLMSKQNSGDSGSDNCENVHQKILHFQCNVERLYGAIEDFEINDLNENPHMDQKLKLLKELYLKMRNELFQPLFF